MINQKTYNRAFTSNVSSSIIFSAPTVLKTSNLKTKQEEDRRGSSET